MIITRTSNIPFRSVQLDVVVEVDFENKIIKSNARSMYILKVSLHDMWTNDSYAIKYAFPLHDENCKNWKFIFTDGEIFTS